MNDLPELKYTPEGFLELAGLYSSAYPYIVIVSSRGGGKTYSTLKWLVESRQKFIYFRRTAEILKIISDPALHPFKRLNEDQGWNLQPRPAKGLTEIVDASEGHGEVIGYMAALSTFSNVRGFDASDIKVLVWDEFIPETNDRIMFNMFTAWTNAIETVNRNRELLGDPPVRVIMLSNSDLIYGDVVAGFHIGDELLRMQETGEELVEHSRDMLLVMPALQHFVDQKADTALYRLTAGSAFANVSLNNKFPIEDRSHIGARPLKEYSPLAVCCGVCFYKHKTNGTFYATTHISGSPPVYQDNKTDLKRFQRKHRGIGVAYVRRKMYYEGVDVQTAVRKLFS